MLCYTALTRRHSLLNSSNLCPVICYLLQRLNGRMAMLGFAGIAITELQKGIPAAEQFAGDVVGVSLLSLSLLLGSLAPKFASGSSLKVCCWQAAMSWVLCSYLSVLQQRSTGMIHSETLQPSCPNAAAVKIAATSILTPDARRWLITCSSNGSAVKLIHASLLRHTTC